MGLIKRLLNYIFTPSISAGDVFEGRNHGYKVYILDVREEYVQYRYFGEVSSCHLSLSNFAANYKKVKQK